MNWKLRALLLRAMATLPGGYTTYQLLQRRVGSHCDPDFYRARLETQRDLARLVLESGGSLVEASVMEVGTGWLPLTAVGFWICGAQEVHTFDVNRHLLPSVFIKALRWMTENEAELVALWDGIVSPDRVVDCLRAIRQLDNHPLDVCKKARIAYHAPADAAFTTFPDSSIDIHYSTYVLEHVSPEMNAAILREASRTLKAGGRAIHFVDPRDHFALFDNTISVINFLQYADPQWNRIAGHFLAYQNRVRDPQYERLFQEAGFELLEHRFQVDPRALRVLEDGFKLAPEFQNIDRYKLCRCDLRFLGRPISK